ncbi:MAG: hypothetical protein V1778_00210 [bacterium]
MNTKSCVMAGLVIGSTLGSLLPDLWGAGWLSLTSVLFSGLGGLVGIWLGFKACSQA